MKNDIEYDVQLNSQERLTLQIPETVFQPTGTTTTLIEAVKNSISSPGSLLDIGCGSGVVGLTLSKEGMVAGPLHASDLSEDAIKCVQDNAKNLGLDLDARCGSLFDPWKDCLFDYIVDDVAGIAKKIAEVSPWYTFAPCDAGEDGAELIVQIIEQAKSHLKPGGQFFFPVITLSNVDRILDVARSQFENLDLCLHKQWPLPPEMSKHTDLLHEMKSKGFIQFEEKFGMILYSTDIYVAKID
ncbi:methyltransferase [Gammaproteobacteria bacterium]|jgi:SAM-dependent methyltransferase|nr:methyltransferase [Gammaproteobacteria bacterium]